LRLYEGMFLIDSNLAAKDWTELETHIQEILKRNRAELLYSERWPDRRLAYDIKGCKKGTYYLTYFNAGPDSIREIENDSRLSERILRLLIIQEQGLDREMERRKNREITAPPTELSFEDDRYESRESGGGFGGRRRAEPGSERAPEAAPVREVSEPAARPAGPEAEAAGAGGE
jgi:small subunit ribosomal protein S6